VDTILQDLAANLKMTLLDAYQELAPDTHGSKDNKEGLRLPTLDPSVAVGLKFSTD
jgi:hypothetical protein